MVIERLPCTILNSLFGDFPYLRCSCSLSAFLGQCPNRASAIRSPTISCHQRWDRAGVVALANDPVREERLFHSVVQPYIVPSPSSDINSPMESLIR